MVFNYYTGAYNTKKAVFRNSTEAKKCCDALNKDAGEELYEVYTFRR